ncbi:flagellar hook protein FlgE [Alkalicaulis satelles]|uniref:Flagellar hook protein FlgE n=1 Tax=Alkalicaulis satelles TaxID=2609175 RepID=A0A5M6ZDA1_9PROT|nr:flagellar hook protein FlgE [Alkalicaulis satelles]KAA5802180.1 flagellar hook protein FlgE [Alkalicaulis satelles]
MSINSAMIAGASGLLANSSALAAISDNIANVNTTGYKRVNTVFTPNYKIGGSGEARYNSAGVTANSRLDVNSAGLLNPSSSPTSLAIDGNGFFVVRPTPISNSGTDAVLFTRSGAFQTDSSGYLRNDAGMYLYAWPVGSDGTVNQNPSNLDQLEAINLSNIGGAAEATSSIRINANLQASQGLSPAAATYDAADPAVNMASGAVAPDFQRTIQVFDSQGGVRSITMSMLKSTTANQWHVELHVEPASDVVTGAGLNNGQIATGVIAFDTNGQINPGATTLPSSLNFLASNNPGAPGANQVQWAPGTGVGAQSINLDLGTAGAPGGITQFDSPSTLNSTTVDGAIFGAFAGVEVGQDGFVSARFTNGVVRRIYQIPVATVANPNGLASVGGASFQITENSGAFTMNAPGRGASGTIASSAVENSNVDIATEFSDLIITQRAYSASSRIITTADEMLAEAIQMKR